MIRRRLLSLIVLTLGCAAVAATVLWQVRRSAHQAAAQAQQKKLFTFAEPAEVHAITLHSPNGTFVLFRAAEKDASWMVESPLHTPADDSATVGLLKNLLEVQTRGQVGGEASAASSPPAKQPGDLSLFGLAPPVFVVTLSGGEGAQTRRNETVLFGKKNSFDGSMYAKRSALADVFWVDGALAFDLDQDLFKLRDKRPLDLKEQDVQALTVSEDSQTRFRIERAGAHFILHEKASPPRPADDAQVHSLLSSLAAMRATLFAHEGADDPNILKTFGLQHPRFEVTVQQTAAPEARLLLATKRMGDQQRYFAMRAGAHPIVEIGSDWAWKKLMVPVAELRDVRLLPVDIAAVARITVNCDGKTLVLQRDEANAMAWRVGEPQKDADPGKVSALLYKLTNLRPEDKHGDKLAGTGIVTTGLQPPARKVSLADANGKSLGELLLGAPGPDGETIYAQAAGQATVTQLDKSALHDVVADPAVFLPDNSAGKTAPAGN